ncbi:MAG TPA: outer membrane protein assembly factor BamD [Syntrophorhabdaceae bacterium]|nr:outer membrane protein assembly factor BamD [Syntrophorhabdaceae bacterium]
MRKFVLFFIICLLLVSCSSKAPKKTENPVDLYVAGVDLMKKKKYDDSIKKFTAIREQYPFDPMALVATVKLGDAYFLKKDYVLAAGTYEDYFKAHPDEENIPYVLFKLGECYEKLSPSVDRDQANTFKGIERITYLRNRYPNSPYAAESEKRLEGFIQKLADRELYVGEFYVRTAQYNAAIMRLELLLKNHPRSKNTDKVLFYLYDAHRQLGNQEKANEYLETLRTKYPKSIYARATIRERKTLKITQAQQPKPAGKEDAVHKQADGTTQTPPPGGTLQSPQGAGTQAQPGASSVGA